jgi:hypothetical protein
MRTHLGMLLIFILVVLRLALSFLPLRGPSSRLPIVEKGKTDLKRIKR